MIFEDSPAELLDSYYRSLESPDLRPISLPMSSHDKSLDGMINLQNATFSFPDSNALVQGTPAGYMPCLPAQYAIPGQYQEGEPDCYSDSDFGYPLEYDNTTTVVPVNLVSQPALPKTIQPPAASRKRKASPSPDFAPIQPQKRTAVSPVHVQDPEGDFYELNEPSPYSPFVPIAPSVHTANNSPRSSHHYSASNASQVSLAAPSPHTPAWSPSFTTVKTEHSPRAPMTPIPRPASAVTSGAATIPKLVRTSTIPQQSSPSLDLGIAHSNHTHTFNPYGMYPQHKASLRLKGDLNAVPNEWTAEELDASRKLVVFTRAQNGSTIDAEFKVVTQDEWKRSDIAVNCIWWKERKEAFVTSVDTISLLEQLVAVRFTVEEKNRIRRNLEGFRPLTVSKAKTESEDFFKVIMGFPNPKPRNIEKDVKVFPWKILAHALKKIISKYSASYSSTASTLVTPATSVYAGPEPASDYQSVPSPSLDMPSRPVPTLSFDALTMMQQQHQQQQQFRMAVQNAAVYAPEMPLHVPGLPSSYDVPVAYHPAVMNMHPYTVPVHQHVMAAPMARAAPSWTYEPYPGVSEGPIAMASAHPSGPTHPHQHGDTAEFMIPPTYQFQYHH